VSFARIAWSTIVAACLIAVVLLLVSGYLGYAAVTFTVALSAAINLR
jgi:general stress protein CsbA